MKINSISLLTIAPILTLALVTGCANPCAGKTKTNSSGLETETVKNEKNPCASISKNVGGPLSKEIQGKPVVVDIYATWCSACKNIAPTLSELKEKYAGEAEFIVFDVTNKSSVDKAQMEAEKLGLGKFFAANKSKTALVAIIDPETGKILTLQHKNSNLADYTSILDSAIAKK